MQTLKRFTYPTFIWLCGLVATLSDILQDSVIATGVIGALLMLGSACVFLPRTLIIDRIWGGVFGNDIGPGFSARPFGLSCLLLAGLMFGFSTLSGRAAEEGGLIASQVPEVRQMQEALGIVQRDVAEIRGIVSDVKQGSFAGGGGILR